MDYYRQLCIAVIVTIVGLWLSRSEDPAKQVVHYLMVSSVVGIWTVTFFLAIERRVRYYRIDHLLLVSPGGVVFALMWAFDGFKDGQNGVYFQLGMLVAGAVCLSICTGRMQMLLHGIRRMRLPPTPPHSPPRLICPQHVCGCRRPEHCSHHSCGCRHVEPCFAHSCGCRHPEHRAPEVCPSHICGCRPLADPPTITVDVLRFDPYVVGCLSPTEQIISPSHDSATASTSTARPTTSQSPLAESTSPSPPDHHCRAALQSPSNASAPPPP